MIGRQQIGYQLVASRTNDVVVVRVSRSVERACGSAAADRVQNRLDLPRPRYEKNVVVSLVLRVVFSVRGEISQSTASFVRAICAIPIYY